MGYLNVTSLSNVAHQGGFFVVRAKEGLNPLVINAYRDEGTPLKGCQERDFQAIVAPLPKRQRVNLIVAWWVEGQPPQGKRGAVPVRTKRLRGS